MAVLAGAAGAESRRAGGGDAPPIVIPLGLMLLALALLSLLFKKLKQSNIIACIIIGGLVGAFKLNETWQLSRTTMQALIELGITLVLFMGGLEVNIKALRKYLRLTLINGCGQIISHWVLFMGIGAVAGIVEGAVAIVVFGLVCTFSSTILVLGVLKKRGDMETLHGQIILGLMVLQDITAVLALSIVPAFKVVDNPADRLDLASEIGIVLGVLVAVIVLLYILSRYALATIFKYFALDGEMLFIGTMGFAIGVAGVCALLSPNVAGLGAFFSGISIASLPYRLEIEKKCEPLRAFGVVLFFFMLGIDLNFTLESLAQAIPYSILISVVTLVVSPIIMWGLGFISGIKGRTAFFNGLIVNQISEFGLILGQTAKKNGIFEESTYQILTVSMLMTFFFSSIGHTHADRIFQVVRPHLLFLDSHGWMKSNSDDDGVELHDHVVLLGFNETGLAVTEFYRQKGKEVYMIELNPALYDCVNALCARGIEEDRHRSERWTQRDRELQDLLVKKQEVEEAIAFNQLLASKFEPLPQHEQRQMLLASASDMTPSASFWDEVASGAQELRASGANVGGGGRCGRDELRWRVNGQVQVDEVDPDDSASVQVCSKHFGFKPQAARLTEGQDTQAPHAEGGVLGHDDDVIGPFEGDDVDGVDDDDKPTSPSGGIDGRLSPQQYRASLRQHKEKRGISRAQSAASAADDTSLCDEEAHDCTRIPTPQDPGTPEDDASSAGSSAGVDVGSPDSQGEGRWWQDGRANRESAFGASFASLRSPRERSETPRNDGRILKKHPGTNIRAVYADPCAPETWQHYNLTRASLVVSCMPDGVSAEMALAPELRRHGVPFLAITNSDDEARELYQCGCTYVVQQEALAAVVVGNMLAGLWNAQDASKGLNHSDNDQLLATSRFFNTMGSQHNEVLKRNSESVYLSQLDSFL